MKQVCILRHMYINIYRVWLPSMNMINKKLDVLQMSMVRGKENPQITAKYSTIFLPIFLGRRYTSCLYRPSGALYSSIKASACEYQR